MRLISYDCEVSAYDWLVTLKDKETGVYTCIWNDNEALKMALSDDCIYVGFNSKHYDQYIIKAIAAGFAPEEIKKVNDFIIAGGQGWQCPLLDGIYFRFSNVDIRDDTQQGLSLNEDWNCSAPHGAGRVMSRSKAKELVSLEEYEDSMKGIFTTSVSRSTIDESPMAYKTMEEIIANIADTVEVVNIIKPVYNFKASE